MFDSLNAASKKKSVIWNFMMAKTFTSKVTHHVCITHILQFFGSVLMIITFFSRFFPFCIYSPLFRLPLIPNTMLYMFCCHYILYVLYI